MVQLVRDSLRAILSDVSVKQHQPHTGLLLTRSLQQSEEGEKPLKRALLEKACQTETSGFYESALQRWKKATSGEGFAGFDAPLEGRLLLGLSTGGALETGVSTHHSYGMPMIAGSSVKGVAHAHARTIGLTPDVLAVLFGEDEETAKDGRVAGAGCLIWHDAWWISNNQKITQPFVDEVVTVHHQEYYADKQKSATDFDSPVPNQQMSVQGGFYFVVEGDAAWASFASLLLKQALQQHGIGAKTAAGYGFFAVSAVGQAGGSHGSSKPSISTEQAIVEWEKAVIGQDKGRGVIIATCAGKKAETKDQSIVPADVLKLLGNKKTLTRKVQVEAKGNMFKLLKILDQ
jgi:CRISPR-associated protein Cmr6